jgi:hypothetical protein
MMAHVLTYLVHYLVELLPLAARQLILPHSRTVDRPQIKNLDGVRAIATRTQDDGKPLQAADGAQ